MESNLERWLGRSDHQVLCNWTSEFLYFEGLWYLDDLWYFFIFSQFDWICCNGPQSVCVCVCVCVCLCVRLCHLYSPNEWTDFDETFHKSSTVHLLNTFFSDFENSSWWRHGGHYCCFWIRHSHGRNFAPIIFKFLDMLVKRRPVFANTQSHGCTMTGPGIEPGPLSWEASALPLSYIPIKESRWLTRKSKEKDYLDRLFGVKSAKSVDNFGNNG